MLNALTDRSDVERRGLLSQAALSLLPQPEEVTVGDDVRAVVAEVRSQLRLSDHGLSPADRTRVQAFLGDLLAAQLLPSDERRNVRSRLGKKGLLRPAQFDIQYNSLLNARGAIYRAKWSHVEEAIHNADVVEHFPSLEGVANAQVISLFMRRSPGRSKRNKFWWLIECWRNGSSVTPRHAWRMYDDRFDFSEIDTPRSAIVKFAEKFGVEMKIGDKSMRIAFREVVASGGKTGHDILIDTPALKLRTPATGEDHVVGFSYSIDNASYAAYLSDHGVPTT